MPTTDTNELFPPALLADLVVQGRSHPSVPTEVIATVLQALGGPSDREAISALRRDIAWKVAFGLRLDDEGLHPTALVYWRNRIRRSSRPRRIVEAVRLVVQAHRGACWSQSTGAGPEASSAMTTTEKELYPGGSGSPGRK